MTEDIEKRKVNYLFTAIPNAMLYNLSGTTLKLFGVLIKKESEWFAKFPINDGLFEVTFDKLMRCCGFDKKTLKEHLELLFRKNIIYIKVGEHKNSRSIIGINWFRILIFENLPIELQEQIKLEEIKVKKEEDGKKKSEINFTFNLENSEKHEQILLEIKWFFYEKYHTLTQKSITKLTKNWQKSEITHPFSDNLSVDIEEFNSFKNGHKDKKKESEKDKKKESEKERKVESEKERKVESEKDKQSETKKKESENGISKDVLNTIHIHNEKEKFEIINHGSVECCSVFDNLPF